MSTGTAAEFAEEIPSLATIRSIYELAELRKFLSGQLDQCMVKLAVSADQSSAANESGQELDEKVAKQKQSLIDFEEKKKLPEDVLRMFLNAQEAVKAVRSDHFPADGEDELWALLRSSIRQKLMLLHQLNTEMYKAQVEKDNLQNQLDDLEAELNSIVAKNKEGMQMLEHANQANTQERLKRECEKAFPEVLKAREELEAEVRNLRNVKQIFQSLIHASKLDWYEDPELCNLLLTLGETADAKASDV